MTGSVQTIHYICFLGAPDLLMASFNVSIGFVEHFLYKKVKMFCTTLIVKSIVVFNCHTIL